MITIWVSMVKLAKNLHYPFVNIKEFPREILKQELLDLKQDDINKKGKGQVKFKAMKTRRPKILGTLEFIAFFSCKGSISSFEQI